MDYAATVRDTYQHRPDDGTLSVGNRTSRVTSPLRRPFGLKKACSKDCSSESPVDGPSGTSDASASRGPVRAGESSRARLRHRVRTDPSIQQWRARLHGGDQSTDHGPPYGNTRFLATSEGFSVVRGDTVTGDTATGKPEDLEDARNIVRDPDANSDEQPPVSGSKLGGFMIRMPRAHGVRQWHERLRSDR